MESVPKDDGKLPGHRKGGIEGFHRSWCLRQRLIEILKGNEEDLQCLRDVDSSSKSEFMALLTLYDADTPYLSQSVCRVIEEESRDEEKQKEEDEQWDTKQVVQFMLSVGDGALRKYKKTMEAELFSAEIGDLWIGCHSQNVEKSKK